MWNRYSWGYLSRCLFFIFDFSLRNGRASGITDERYARFTFTVSVMNDPLWAGRLPQLPTVVKKTKPRDARKEEKWDGKETMERESARLGETKGKEGMKTVLVNGLQHSSYPSFAFDLRCSYHIYIVLFSTFPTHARWLQLWVYVLQQ